MQTMDQNDSPQPVRESALVIISTTILHRSPVQTMKQRAAGCPQRRYLFCLPQGVTAGVIPNLWLNVPYPTSVSSYPQKALSPNAIELKLRHSLAKKWL